MPFVLFALFPLYFMLVTSFKKNAELYDVTSVPFLIKRGVTLVTISCSRRTPCSGAGS